ncbi:hypothetical protein ACFYU5_33365 [Nocardia aobensis]|jgi:hypothetical protein|uniref:ABC-type Na+ efflux pump permease subunit n=2 Tax=Nocardia TaxID=1817 RepID=A0ABU1XEM8_9NOCA|nr:hypothetical protein [Nocardia kruczakiae]MDR7168989.1 ABC-type Na+ efflux pump permease subunit [Nocardia kruczakiae]
MGSQLGYILFNILQFVRWAGIIIIAIAGMALLISEGVKSKLSPGKVLGVAASAIVAAILFWILPTVVNYARVDSNRIVPDQPVGGVYGH